MIAFCKASSFTLIFDKLFSVTTINFLQKRSRISTHSKNSLFLFGKRILKVFSRICLLQRWSTFNDVWNMGVDLHWKYDLKAPLKIVFIVPDSIWPSKFAFKFSFGAEVKSKFLFLNRFCGLVKSLLKIKLDITDK
jgi:hypothetical protein